MLTNWVRVIYSDNAVLRDISLDMVDNSSTGFNFVASEDKIYIGQYFPFNNFFLELGSNVNSNASNLNIEYWDGNSWENAVDILDGTKVGTATLAKSGIVQFSPDRHSNWGLVIDTSTENSFPLDSLTIYDLYWIRLSFSANPTAIDIKRLAYSFTTNEVMSGLDPDINQFLTAWQSGKTNWNEQILLGSSHLVLDMRTRSLVRTASQIIRFDDVFISAAWKTLALIYNGLGDKYNPKRDYAESKAKETLNLSNFTLDTNMDGMVTRSEVADINGKLVR